MKAYKVLTEKSTGFYKEKGSKFWSYAFPVANIEQAEKAITDVKIMHPASNHHCFAYRIGIGDTADIRANDDGEPVGSAGLPILNQIKSAGITYTLVVVARDFGGTKLGVSGLINAYKIAAREAILNGKLIEKYEQAKMTLHFDFEVHSEIMSILNRHNMEVINSDFSSNISFQLLIKKDEIEEKKLLFSHLPVEIEID